MRREGRRGTGEAGRRGERGGGDERGEGRGEGGDSESEKVREQILRVAGATFRKCGQARGARAGRGLVSHSPTTGLVGWCWEGGGGWGGVLGGVGGDCWERVGGVRQLWMWGANDYGQVCVCVCARARASLCCV